MEDWLHAKEGWGELSTPCFTWIWKVKVSMPLGVIELDLSHLQR
jgi:hypothetical protein